jgi:hypothetical protein
MRVQLRRWLNALGLEVPYEAGAKPPPRLPRGSAGSRPGHLGA